MTCPDAGFNTETNLVKIIGRDGSIKELPLLSKQKVAKTILDAIESLQK